MQHGTSHREQKMSIEHDCREFSRVDVPVRVEIERPGQQPLKAVVRDISMNGMRINASEMFSADVPCDVKIILGNDKGEAEAVVIEAHGCAVRSDGEYVAIHFDNLELEGYNHLKRLILYHALDTEQIEHEFDQHIGLHRKDG